jgi:hypothetical protein
MSLTVHPPSRRVLVVVPVRRIIGGLNLREALNADGMDLSDPVLEGHFLDLTILQRAFQGDELPLLKRPGELR